MSKIKIKKHYTPVSYEERQRSRKAAKKRYGKK